MTRPALILHNTHQVTAKPFFGIESGFYESGGNLFCWCPVWDLDLHHFLFGVFKSTDAGLTWAQCDAANSPIFGGNGEVTAQPFGGQLFIPLFASANAGIEIFVFDFASEVFVTPIPNGPRANTGAAPFGVCAMDCKILSNGDIVVAFYPSSIFGPITNTLSVALCSGGTWSARVDIQSNTGHANRLLMAILDASDTVNVIWEEVTGSTAGTVSNTQWTAGAVSNVDVIAPMALASNYWHYNGDANPVVAIGRYSAARNAIVIPLYNRTGSGQIEFLIGTLGVTNSYSIISGPSPSFGSDAQLPSFAFNSDESFWYVMIDIIPAVGVDDQIEYWKSTDQGASWSGGLLFYDHTTDPPTPPPPTVDGMEGQTFRVLADGTLATVIAIPTDPVQFFCGEEYYFSIPPEPPVTRKSPAPEYHHRRHAPDG